MNRQTATNAYVYEWDYDTPEVEALMEALRSIPAEPLKRSPRRSQESDFTPLQREHLIRAMIASAALAGLKWGWEDVEAAVERAQEMTLPVFAPETESAPEDALVTPSPHGRCAWERIADDP
jgi:hypothetical protein